MPRESNHGEFTGRHMLMVLVAGFGVVVAVNFFMASVAARGFSGVVVENSYVASQKFNGWLDKAEQQETLGWEATIQRGKDGSLLVITKGVPASARAKANIRRPLGAPEKAEMELISTGMDSFTSSLVLPEGRWIVRLTIESSDQQWRQEDYLL